MKNIVGVLHAALSWPSLLLAAVTAGFSLFNLSQRGMTPGINAWDLVVPHLANLQLTSLLIATLWASAVVAQHRRLEREEVLLRCGSWRSAVAATLAGDLIGILGALGLSVLVALVIGASRGLDDRWSASALQVLENGGVDTEVSASAAAQHASTPWWWLVVHLVWLLTGLMALTAVHAAVTLLNGPRVAHGVMILLAVAGVLTGAGFFGPRAFPDVSAWTNFLWAVDRPVSVALALMAWTGALALLVVAVSLKDGRLAPATLRQWPAPAAVGASILLLLLYTWAALPAHGVTAQVTVEISFGGQYSSLVGHVLGALPAATAATVVAHRLGQLEGGQMATVLLRWGTVRRWLAPGVAATSLLMVAATLLTVIAAAALGQACAGPAAPGDLDAGRLTVAAVSYALFGLTLAASALVLFWTRGHVREWPVLVLAVVVLGYPMLLPPTPLNPFSAYSLAPGAPMSWPGVLIQVLLLAAVLNAALRLVRRHRLPQNL